MSRRTGLRVVEGFGEEVVGDDVVAEVVAAEDFDEEGFLVEDFMADSPGLEVLVRELVVDDGFSLDDCAAAPGAMAAAARSTDKEAATTRFTGTHHPIDE